MTERLFAWKDDVDAAAAEAAQTAAEAAQAAAEAAQAAAEAAASVFTDEYVQDLVGAMFSGNTETRITVDYQDSDGTIDLVVEDDLSLYDNATSAFLTAVTAGALYQPLDADLTDLADPDALSEDPTPSIGSDYVILFSGTGAGYFRTKLSDLPGGSGGASNFLQLSDTPTDYTGASLQLVRVKSDETGLEFFTGAFTADAISFSPTGDLSSTDVQAALAELDTEKQPLDSDLTAIAALSPSNDDIIQRKTGAWTNRTMAQLIADLGAVGTTFQPLDSDLTSWAGVTRASGFDTFAATPSSANLASLVTDETGTAGKLVFSTSPQFTTDIRPSSNDGASLGISGTAFSDLFLASGAVVNWNNSDVTLTHSADTLTMAGGTLVLPASGLQVGSSNPFSDSAGTLTLQNVDALDATTESTVEAAIDTLANLTSVQGRTVTLADAGADALFGWDDSGNQYVNLSAADAFAVIKSSADAVYQPLDSDLTSIAALTTTAAGRSALTVVDNNLDQVLFWDDSAGTVKTMVLADMTAEASPASGDYIVLYGAEGDVRKVDWADLPGASGGIGNVVEDLTPQLGGDLDPNSFGVSASWNPASSDGAALGSTTKMWSDLFLASGAVINFNNGDVTLTHTSDTLTMAGGTLVLPASGLQVGSSNPFSDSAGTLTLQNVDALDATTESTVEAAIDTLANLTSVQGQTISISAPLTIPSDPNADRMLFWDDSGGATAWLAPGNSIAITTTTIDTIQDIRTTANPQFATIELGAASDTTLARSAAGQVTIEGNRVYSAKSDQFSALSEKTALVGGDLFLVEDSANSGAKVKVQTGNIAPYIFHNLATDASGTNGNSAQPWFPDTSSDAVTLADNTTYRFAGFLRISRSAGTTSHTTAISFGGTATIASLKGIATVKTGDTTASAAANSTILDDASSIVVKAASSSATEQVVIVVEGTVRIGTSGGGTFIPQFTYSAAPGGVPTIKANSFFELAPIGTDLVVSAGTWS